MQWKIIVPNYGHVATVDTMREARAYVRGWVREDYSIRNLPSIRRKDIHFLADTETSVYAYVGDVCVATIEADIWKDRCVVGFRTMNTWTYFETFQLTSWGNGVNYGLDYINPDGSIIEVAYLQDDESVLLFEEALDRCLNRDDFQELWSSYYYENEG